MREVGPAISTKAHQMYALVPGVFHQGPDPTPVTDHATHAVRMLRCAPIESGAIQGVACGV
jgi:hypothetical protein